MAEDIRQLDLETFRNRFDSKSERSHWVSPEELADEDSFMAMVSEEFPQQAVPLSDGVGRRDFMKLMGSSLALAGLAGCMRPPEQIVPYINQPENIVPGKPMFFATAMTLGGVATGLLVESHMGRPTKVEGNPDHPGSLGATDVFAQASVLDLYDPDRSRAVRRRGSISTWTEFLGALGTEMQKAKETSGAGFAILTEPVNSPTLGAQMRKFLTMYPSARWYQYEPHGRDNIIEGARMALGTYANTIYSFDKADVVVSLDSDFLASGPGSVRHARDFMSKRRIRKGTMSANRLYCVETMVSPTGSAADHRLRLKPSTVESFAFALGAAVGATTGAEPLDGGAQAWLKTVVQDLEANRGRSIVIAGPDQPAEVHAIAHAINEALGNVGVTVRHTDPLETNPVIGRESIRQLVADIDSGKVSTLMIVGGNPVFNAPADLDFRAALEKVAWRAHMSMTYDETSENCQWHVPMAHYLEAWSDARAFDGTVSIVQPLIAPLYNGRNPHELLAVLTDDANTPHEIVRNHWREAKPGLDFNKSWHKWLRDGVVDGTAMDARPLQANGGSIKPRGKAGAMELIFRPDPAIHDGRFANNGWLQELPKPVTKLTWDNAALMSAATATRLGLVGNRSLPGEGVEKTIHYWSKNAPMVEIASGDRTIKVPVWIVPGHADDAITLHTGYGRTRGGEVAKKGKGFNTYSIRTHDTMSWTPVEVTSAEGDYQLACTQLHHVIPDGRDIVRSGTLEDFKENPALADVHEGPHSGEMSLYPKWETETGYSWGMSIDTTVCTGCNACVIACHSENNIAIVGKDQVLIGRELHWMRIDTYFKGSPDNPSVTVNQPVMCQHCENAPCEPVCPVEATSHSTEGINEMTYNRCVGTRYCANNCPYKVRRFNWFQFADWKTESLKLMRNPDVTVRSRGVMEKCTFCVQRVNAARIEAEKGDRKIRDGEIVTACQASCPTQAIVFGDIEDPKTQVSLLKTEPHNFKVLEDVNTRPRASYLGAVRNKNPEISEA